MHRTRWFVSSVIRKPPPKVATQDNSLVAETARVLISTGITGNLPPVRECHLHVAFGEALSAGTRLALFSDDKPDRLHGH